jgi:hypothetical protein
MMDQFEKLTRKAIADLQKLDREGLFDEACDRFEELNAILNGCHAMLTDYVRESIEQKRQQLERSNREIAIIKDQTDQAVSVSNNTSAALH